MFLISDEILERLTCSQCKKYLSVKPIKVYPNRSIKCGRCSNPEDAGVLSLFDIIAEEAVFRCTNRYEGCIQLLTYSEVIHHEITCKGRQYECPACTLSYKGTGYDIFSHFKERHEDRLLINVREFIIDVENEFDKVYLYCKNDSLFFVHARYNRGEEELVLHAAYFGSEEHASKITQMFSLYSTEGNLMHRTKRRSCCSVIGGNCKFFKLSVSPEDFPKKIAFCKLDLSTDMIRNALALPEGFKKYKIGESPEGFELSDGPVKVSCEDKDQANQGRSKKNNWFWSSANDIEPSPLQTNVSAAWQQTSTRPGFFPCTASPQVFNPATITSTPASPFSCAVTDPFKFSRK